MIQTEFDVNTLTNMQMALERCCGDLPGDMQGHDERKFVANRIIDSAKRGNVTLTELTATGKRAVVELLSRPLTEPDLVQRDCLTQHALGSFRHGADISFGSSIAESG